MENKFVSIIIDEPSLSNLIIEYQNYAIDNAGEYIVFFANYNNIIITAYKNNKNSLYKVTFNGKNCEKEALKFSDELIYPKKKKIIKTSFDYTEDQMGSDEVGTGDLFGPICVCAAYVKKLDIPYLKELGINDSKKLTDGFILKTVPMLLDKITYTQIPLYNEKYNELIIKGFNMNEIKAIMHNKALLSLKDKIDGNPKIIIDQFCDPDKYYDYISNQEKKLHIDKFETKAESKYICVALASMFARYSFLKKIQSLNEEYSVNIPFGAGIKADIFLKEFVDKYGMQEAKKILKINFKNIGKLFKKD